MKFMIVCLAIAGVASAASFNARVNQNNPYAVQQQYARSDESVAPVLRSISDISPDGTYQYSYETGNGITGEESGLGGVRATGSNSYTAPDGTPIQLTYTADENGFHPVGAHIPTSPPIPEAILRSLAWIAAQPQRDVNADYRQIAPQPFRNIPTQRPYYQIPAQQQNYQNQAYSAYRRQ